MWEWLTAGCHIPATFNLGASPGILAFRGINTYYSARSSRLAAKFKENIEQPMLVGELYFI